MANDYTPQQIEEILQMFFDVAGTRQYIGARYVPIFGRGRGTPVDWDNSDSYEPLSIVYYMGDTYTSRQYVPAGVDINDVDYWVITGRYNAQVERYRQEVLGFSTRIDGAYSAISSLRDDVADEYVPFPDSNLYPKYGTNGQVLTTLSDGTTKWEDPVVPSDAQAESVITEWLNDHPEATTTVQDGAVTTAKIANGAVTDAKLDQTRWGILSREAADTKDLKSRLTIGSSGGSFDGGQLSENMNPTRVGENIFRYITLDADVLKRYEHAYLNMVNDSSYKVMMNLALRTSDGTRISLSGWNYVNDGDDLYTLISSDMTEQTKIVSLTYLVTYGNQSDAEADIADAELTFYISVTEIVTKDFVNDGLDKKLENTAKLVDVPTRPTTYTPNPTAWFALIDTVFAANTTIRIRQNMSMPTYLGNVAVVDLASNEVLAIYTDTNDQIINITVPSYIMLFNTAYLPSYETYNVGIYRETSIAVGDVVSFDSTVHSIGFDVEVTAILNAVDVYTASVISKNSNEVVTVAADGTGKYTTIIQAMNYEPEGTPIYIMPGVYNQDMTSCLQKRVILIGTDRNQCIIRDTDGRYGHHALYVSCGYFENLTIEEPYVSGTSQEIDGTTNGGYAVHIDADGDYGIGKQIEFHHCNIYSDFFPAIGCGLRKDLTLIIDDCTLKNGQVNGRGNYISDGTLGALYVHDSNGEQGDQYLFVKDSLFTSNFDNAICLYKTPRETQNNEVHCTFINNVLYSETNHYTNTVWFRNDPFDPDTGIFDIKIGYGNSISSLNN